MNTCRIKQCSSLVAAAAVLPLLVSVSSPAQAQSQGLTNQWYFGLGGTVAFLQPDPDQPGNNTAEPIGSGGTIMIGRDLDSRSSLQLQLLSLGEAELDSGDTAAYAAADASVLFRFFDSRDNRFTPSVFGTSFYGRFALGFLNRDSDTDLERDSEVYFGAGAGIETYFTNNIALRAEGFFHDIDAVSGSLSLVFRLGRGSRRTLASLPTNGAGPSSSRLPAEPSVSAPPTAPISPSISAPAPAQLPSQAPSNAPSTQIAAVPRATLSGPDTDNDGVVDNDDQCASSTPDYPVRDDGCALLDGVLSGVKFVSGSPMLAPGSEEQLDFLADILANRFPAARIELHSHTDNEGDVRSQAILTRGRLRTVGTYLLDRGVRANRLVLRSFGGSRPLYDNNTSEGRALNNRIEILERPQ